MSVLNGFYGEPVTLKFFFQVIKPNFETFVIFKKIGRGNVFFRMVSIENELTDPITVRIKIQIPSLIE